MEREVNKTPYIGLGPQDGFREGCTCGLIGPFARVDAEHQEHCALRRHASKTSHLDARISVRQPVDRDEYSFKLLVNLVTYDAGTVMNGVPEEHRAFLGSWLMTHTTLLTQVAAIDGFSMMHVYPNPREFVKYFVEQMAHSLAHPIGEAINTRVQDQLKTEMHLPANARPTEEKDT